MNERSKVFDTTYADKERSYLPVVSVITPVLNGIKHVQECLHSVLNQDYPYVEHIFADGGSTDGTLDVLKQFHSKFSDKVFFFSGPDKSPADAVNNALKRVKGEIIGILCADDTYPDTTIKNVVDFFGSNPDAYFLFGSCNYMNEKGEFVRTVSAREFNLHEMIHGRFYIYGPSAFYRKALFDKIGLFIARGDEAVACDLDLLTRAGKVVHMYHTDKVLSNFRMRQWRLSGESWARSKAFLKASYMITKRYGGTILSWSARAYFVSNLIDWIRPVFGFTYPLIDKLVEKYRFRKSHQ